MLKFETMKSNCEILALQGILIGKWLLFFRLLHIPRPLNDISLCFPVCISSLPQPNLNSSRREAPPCSAEDLASNYIGCWWTEMCEEEKRNKWMQSSSLVGLGFLFLACFLNLWDKTKLFLPKIMTWVKYSRRRINFVGVHTCSWQTSLNGICRRLFGMYQPFFRSISSLS